MFDPTNTPGFAGRVDAEAAIAAARLGATSAVIICFYADGANTHIVDGGYSPLPRKELYTNLASYADLMEAKTDGIN